MLVPPSADPMMMGAAAALSTAIARYISRATLIFSATITLLTGFPSAPVCFVTRECPSIFSATASASPGFTTWTPPESPVAGKLPRPLPPASTCALSTTSSPPPTRFAASFASLAEANTSLRGTVMPAERIISAPCFGNDPTFFAPRSPTGGKEALIADLPDTHVC